MKGSLRIAKLFGIPVEIHWTFLLLLFWAFFAGGGDISNWQGMLVWLLTIVALFTCVVLHEFGHALTARRFGVKTRDIILSPIGGVARLENLPEKPIQEFWVAIAGPLVNVAIILALIPLQLLFPSTLTHFLSLFSEESNSFLWEMFRLEYMVPFLITINMMLVLFNLLPAFPMDGGRVMRALLAIRLGRVKATRWASRMGQVIALGFFLFGLWQGNLVLSFIGLFVFFAARSEYRYVWVEHLLGTKTLGDILPQQFTWFQPDDPLHTAGDALQRGQGPNFPVLNEEGDLVGILMEKQLVETLQQKLLYPVRVRDIMIKPGAILSADTPLRKAYTALGGGQKVLPVTSSGRLIGLIDLRQINQFVQLQEKMNRRFFRKAS